MEHSANPIEPIHQFQITELVPLFNVGGNWLQRREYRSVADDLEALEAVTTADIRSVLKKFPLSACSTIAVGPLEKVAQPK